MFKYSMSPLTFPTPCVLFCSYAKSLLLYWLLSCLAKPDDTACHCGQAGC